MPGSSAVLVEQPSAMWWRAWPKWAGPAASGLAALLACLALVSGLLNHRTFVGIPNGALPSAGVMLVGAVTASATWRSWGVRMPGPVSWVLSGVATLTLAGSCFVLLDLIQLVLTGSVTDRDGNSDWVAFGERLGSAAVGVLVIATATSWRRRTSGVCPRCGHAHSPDVLGVERPAPCAATERVCRIAYAGCCAFLPYLALHGLHFAGLAPWLDHLYSDQSILPGPPLLVFAVLVIGLVGPAVFLLLGLVRPWGMVFPRWCLGLAGKRVPRFLPLAPVWLVAPTLALYGTGSFGYALVAGYNVIGLGGAASLAFGGYGWALGVAAVSYQRRSRPVCVVRRASAQ
jgi:hypothetical protein